MFWECLVFVLLVVFFTSNTKNDTSNSKQNNVKDQANDRLLQSQSQSRQLEHSRKTRRSHRHGDLPVGIDNTDWQRYYQYQAQLQQIQQQQQMQQQHHQLQYQSISHYTTATQTSFRNHEPQAESLPPLDHYPHQQLQQEQYQHLQYLQQPHYRHRLTDQVKFRRTRQSNNGKRPSTTTTTINQNNPGIHNTHTSSELYNFPPQQNHPPPPYEVHRQPGSAAAASPTATTTTSSSGVPPLTLEPYPEMAKKQSRRQKNPSAVAEPSSHKLQSQTTASASSAAAFKPTKLEREGIKKFPQLALHGLYPRYVEADGNCMFRALADQLNGSDTEHRRIRAEVCDYISAHRARFEGFIMDMEFDDYVARMRDELWGDGCALVAFAKIRGINIIVYSEGLGVPPMRIGCNDDAEEATSDVASSIKLRRRKGKDKPKKVRESAVAAKRMRNSSSRKRATPGASSINSSSSTTIIDEYEPNNDGGGAEYLGKRRPTLYLALDEEEHYWSVRRIAGPTFGASDIDPNLEGAF
jgi:hypothetical protein